MKIFKINDRIEIVCESESTRYGFRHLATLMVNGSEFANGKCTYHNRTWERYEFQSVLKNVINKSDLSEKEKKLCNDFIDDYKENDSTMRTTMAIAKLGDLFCDDKKSKNDWKKRMIKAGLQNRGLQFPDDWDKFSEDDKENRLNHCIEMMKK